MAEIYISTAWLSAETQEDAVEYLVENGIKKIELSGGKRIAPGSERRLIELKQKYGLKYLAHNYFFDRPGEYAVNLASLNDDVYRYSLEYLRDALAISNRIGAEKFGFHAGYLVDIPVNRLGRQLERQPISDKKKSQMRFFEAYKVLLKRRGNVELYIENNVLSEENYRAYEGSNPLMLTHNDEIEAFRRTTPFRLLLDIGHLKVSAGSLGLDYCEEFEKIICGTDYLHVSDNDGRSDQHIGLTEGSEQLRILRLSTLGGKTVTLEIRGDISEIKETVRLIEGSEA